MNRGRSQARGPHLRLTSRRLRRKPPSGKRTTQRCWRLWKYKLKWLCRLCSASARWWWPYTKYLTNFRGLIEILWEFKIAYFYLWQKEVAMKEWNDSESCVTKHGAHNPRQLRKNLKKSQNFIELRGIFVHFAFRFWVGEEEKNGLVYPVLAKCTHNGWNVRRWLVVNQKDCVFVIEMADIRSGFNNWKNTHHLFNSRSFYTTKFSAAF